ncbi:MAG: hypothetical protein QOI59_5891 [Gammaproteobacteria bacterium]|jgi:hypothetical protein|nr:hypothetical protein [Gammaproteobacteria bacterium]
MYSNADAPRDLGRESRARRPDLTLRRARSTSQALTSASLFAQRCLAFSASSAWDLTPSANGLGVSLTGATAQSSRYFHFPPISFLSATTAAQTDVAAPFRHRHSSSWAQPRFFFRALSYPKKRGRLSDNGPEADSLKQERCQDARKPRAERWPGPEELRGEPL